MRTHLAILAATALALPAAARADEGMWTFDAFPTAQMKAEYGWAPDQAWLDRVQAAAVRLTGGCSASFVSPSGLILTNHHCVVGCLQNLSTGDNNLVANGINTPSLAEERKCPGQQAEVVTTITDVTPTLSGAIGQATGQALVSARDAAVAKLESAGDCANTDTIRCQVVTLFGGGQYKLYKYRKYSDVRVVWAPEFQAAFFGGDPDNFNFPRYALDSAFLRAYENDRPVATPAHLTWDPRAPKDGETTFVVGNPGRTQRLFTQAQVAFARDQSLPLRLLLLSEYRGRLIQAMSESPEKAREGADELFGTENSYKAIYGQRQALVDRDFAAKLATSERDLRAAVAASPQAGAIGDPWAQVSKGIDAYRNFALPFNFLEAQAGGGSTLYNYAETLVRAAEEREKPNGERLPGFTDAALPLLAKRLTDPQPVYPWLERLDLDFWLSKTREYLGTDDPTVKALLGKDSPEAKAERLVAGSTLADPAVRKTLFEGGLKAVRASKDPMIQFALANETLNRPLIERYKAEVDGPITAAQTKLAQARLAGADAASLYPDATFTLRISYGKVAGWFYRGTTVPYETHMAGVFDRATGQQPFVLAKAFVANKGKIDGATVYDFVTTNDIIGGNSGSPVIARDGSVIGAAFDGNIHSLGGNFGYDGALNRTVVVSSAAVQEGLETIYPAPRLVKELKGG